MFNTGLFAPVYQWLHAKLVPQPPPPPPPIPEPEPTPPGTFTLRGRVMTIIGADDDAYFLNAQAFFDNHPELEKYAEANLAPDSICLDVGANIGLTTLLLCTLCPQGHVYAFEASPINATFLRHNMVTNGITNCTIIEMAAGDRPGELDFHTSGASSHIMTEAHMYQREWPSVKVPVGTIDQVVSDLQIDRIDFIKMDIEGFEPMALAGAAATITRLRPSIFMEFNSWSLYFAHRFDPIAFARSLWLSFDVSLIDRDGCASLSTDHVKFVHDNMTQHGCVDDVLLTPKAAFLLPSASDMVRAA